MNRLANGIVPGLAAGVVLLATARPAQAEHGAAVCELTIRGHSIVELTLVERGRLSQLRFENPGDSIRLSAGEYRVERVELQEKVSMVPSFPPPGPWFEVSAEGPNELAVGAPLYPTAFVRRYGAFLRLDYDLVDGAGRSYRQACTWSASGASALRPLWGACC